MNQGGLQLVSIIDANNLTIMRKSMAFFLTDASVNRPVS